MSILWARTDKKIAEYQKELINTHYQEVENMYKKMRMWRHDYRNHIQLLKALADKGDYGRLREYLDELDTDLHTVDTIIKTGNPMVDAILNSKISLASSKDISVQADAHIPVRLSTPELDLCCILGNLFDNAIDAVLPLPPDERIIRIGYEGEPAVYFLYELYRAEKEKKGVRALCHHEGRGPRARSYAGGCDSGAAGRIFKQKFRGRSLYNRNTAATEYGVILQAAAVRPVYGSNDCF